MILGLRVTDVADDLFKNESMSLRAFRERLVSEVEILLNLVDVIRGEHGYIITSCTSLCQCICAMCVTICIDPLQCLIHIASVSEPTSFAQHGTASQKSTVLVAAAAEEEDASITKTKELVLEPAERGESHAVRQSKVRPT